MIDPYKFPISLRIRKSYHSVKESSMLKSWPRHGVFSLYSFTFVVMEVCLLVDEVDAEEVVNQVELLLVTHSVELAGHLVVSHQLDSQ